MIETEENIAIMIADLSGYTALTESHGAESAADLIDRYLDIVENCLAGDCKIHERTGDEVMIVSASSDFLLASACRIIKATSNEDNFLQVHGGLHYGKILKRRNGYFGSAIILTSRIAAKASPGSFWCSEEFINSLSDKTPCNLQTKGKQVLKNVSEQKEMFELLSENKNSPYIDSVCRMLILDTDKAIKHPTSEDIFFCSAACLDIFMKNQSPNPEVC